MMRDGSGRLLVDQTKAFFQFETLAELAEQAALYDEEQPRLGVARFVLGLLGEVLAMTDGENDD